MSGKYDSLKLKSGQVITEQWFNALGDALNELHALITDGQHDINTNSASIKTANIESLNAVSASFTNRPTAEGRPVLLDGDPITVADLGDSATQKITQSIDASITLQSLLTELQSATQKITQSIDASTTLQSLASFTLQSLLTELQPASASGSVTASSNTDGLAVILNKGGRPNVDVFYSLGGAGNIYIEVSLDGSTWRSLDTVSLASAGSGVKIYQGIAYPYVRVRADATGIDIVFEVVATR